ncbi:Protein of unknown function, DUF547 [Cnuella takakiae]|uniref:DUF547 domain-containing protein n=1 Tax=Cnuella takakiae TaxID=1302690 RepID=A0A1M5H3R3_9BACT|nr:DUF547 domain-containing protein [Cnuella takakiae]OLY91125.1 hypothetical protein BUE76_03805 [Cnuella takakiae]SHG10649.1 Protein of unknown function, DUF547 [Cnuella takakiae]
MVPANNPPDAIDLSQQLLLAVRNGADANGLLQQLATMDSLDLLQQLYNDALRLTFWLNGYNAFVQILLQQEPALYTRRRAFFGRMAFVVAGMPLSLDDIEHGILRRSRIWWGLGFLQDPLPSIFEIAFRLQTPDCRIHFALNCGAASCPPIAVYRPEMIHAQLDLATRAYLSTEARYDSRKNIVYLPRLFLWFWGDFGGRKGTLKLLEHCGIITAGSRPKMRFKSYDWNLAPGSFVPEP